MKKIFTLIALFAVALGAKADWVQDYKIEYSSYTGFPFYVMGYVPEWIDGVMTDMGNTYKCITVDGAEETSDVIVKTHNGVEYYRVDNSTSEFHQYFIADGIPTELDGSYTVKAMVKASETVTFNVNMGWGWGDGQQASASVTVGTEWAEVEWEYSGIGGTSCNLVAQPQTAAKIEWQWVTVSHNQQAVRPVTWQEWLTSDGQPVIVETTAADIPTWMGNAETPWADPNVRFNDQENNYLICAWSKEKGENMNDDGGWDPFPAGIEEIDGNHVFVCHGREATTEGDPSAWDNQFWIQSPQAWKSGTQVKLHFRYKASKTVTTNTQIHKQNPSDYLIWHAIGDITFTEQWQEFDNTFTFSDDMADGWSIAFNLNPNDKEAIDFYFDDLSWQTMKLDEGLFVASSNAEIGIEYDFDNATEFVYDEDWQAYIATVGTEGDEGSWVNEVMISTVRGNTAAFKGATIKPSGSYIGEDEWGNYTESSLAKIKLPAAGVWQIAVDTENKQINFVKIEGEEDKEPIEINPNETVVVVHGLERDYTSSEQPGDVEAGIAAGKGQPWDNQFFIIANRPLNAGEVTILEFDYVSSVDAKTTTQCHNMPGGYMHWGCIGDVNFSTEEQSFSTTFTIPSEADGMRTIAFNMAEIKEACDYTITNIVWKLEDETESLIDQEGTKNFYVKEGAGTDPYEFGTEHNPASINGIVNSNNASSVAYNLNGQRVTKNYKGIVVKNGSKHLAK
jgi:hypothetical protein